MIGKAIYYGPGGHGGGGKDDKDDKRGKPEKDTKKYTVTVYVYSGGGYNDPAMATALPSFVVEVRVRPREYFSEADIDKMNQNIIDNGFIYIDPKTKIRTSYPPNRISHIESEPGVN